MSRKSTARINPARSAQNDRTVARLSGPGFIVTTRKTAARVSGADTGWGTAPSSAASLGAVIEIETPSRGTRPAKLPLRAGNVTISEGMFRIGARLQAVATASRTCVEGAPPEWRAIHPADRHRPRHEHSALAGLSSR